MNEKIGFGVVVLVFGMVILGCNNSSANSALAGRWLPNDNQLIPSSFPEKNMELLKDGKGIIDGYEFTWRTENGRFYITNPFFANAYNYKISGSTLTLTDDDDESIIYTKKK